MPCNGRHNNNLFTFKTSNLRKNLFLVCIILQSFQYVRTSLPFDTQPEERELCTGQPEVGPCKSFVHKWYYMGTMGGPGNCTMFVWGGCGGNAANRFNSEAECLHHCIGDTFTLPPYLTSSLAPSTTSSSTVPPTLWPPASTLPPVPRHERGKELTFAETGRHKTFMFAKDNTFIQLDGEIIQTFQLRICREISFRFRTRLPHGLLVYHNVKNLAGLKMQPYALYVIVEKGQLKVVHVFGKHLTSVTVGQGLNRDEWHNVVVRIDVHGARLIAKVDQQQEEVYLKGLNHDTNYGISSNLTSVVLIGGLSSEEKLHGVKYIIESFIGCISDMVLSSGKAASDLLPIEPLIATKHENVKEGCINKCRTRENLCFFGSTCINHYNYYTCDCFGMEYEGEQCDIYSATTLTLRGSSYVSYRVYDWKDRVHSAINRISMVFKTRYDNSVLFYASGETSSLKHHYIAISIKNNSVYIEMDFGDGPITCYIGTHVNLNHWNTLSIYHNNRTVEVTYDLESRTFEIPGPSYHLYIDPEIYIGGGPELNQKKGLLSDNNFVGNFKYVFYNDISIIYELKKGNPKVHYIGVLEPEFYETDVDVIPITYPFASSHIWWPINTTTSLNLTFDFKSSRNMAVLAYSDVITTAGAGYWEVRVVKEEIRFELVPDSGNNITHLTSVKFDPRGTWHTVDLHYNDGGITLAVDFKNKHTEMFALKFNLANKIIIGSGLKSANSGLVGCMRDIRVNGVLIEPRYVIKTERVVGEVAIDNCMFVDPCLRPNTCEHGGRCSVRDDRIVCDCSGTGYIGKNCHFAKFRKTCEELALLGYTQPDVYLIDIDGNGRFPPAHVKCEFQTLEDATKTIVEHNLPSQVDVRPTDGDFSFSIKYREFSAEMLQELISHSLYCSQHIKYDCYMAPLELHSATWFLSSARNDTVDYLGNVKRGSCPCGVNRTCINKSLSCNCDISENKWHSDEGYYIQPQSLGIIEMVFLQQKDLDENALGRITLGPLECVETNTQQYVVTFTTSQSYIEVPGWIKGDIAFSFRTTGTSAILLFQPPIRPNYPSFMVALTSDYQLTFNFTLNTGTTREMVINSKRKLNGGEWHKIWIDYNFYHVRFMINTEYQMVDLLLEEEFGPFEGSMFIGGATADLLKKSAVKQGLIGCFRGLVVNGEILDIYSYMSVHLSEIIKDCKPSCVPNPCQNKAVCKELWSTFQCICQNPWAHLGTHCEININTKALTFITPDSYLRKNYLSSNATVEEKNRFKKMMFENLLVNLRTYDSDALVLYANDHLNNFFHLYIAQGNKIVYLFNHGNEIVNLSVGYDNLNKGDSIQLAIVREENSTTLHVNEKNATIHKTALLLTEYSNKPWMNPEAEVLRPQRPPSPPADYFQLNLGGIDSHSLVAHAGAEEGTKGYVGCVRGLKIGGHVIDLPQKAQLNIDQDLTGVLPHCNMKCDLDPCKNGGICTEDFSRQESSCDCEHTSYFGEFCMEEKGADFSGESVLQRKFVLEGPVEKVKVQLAFSSNDLRQKNTVLLLLQTENQRSYYLLVAITPEGYLKFEEDREGSAFGAEIKDRNFLNGARHSLYYTRNGSDASLLIDRSEIQLLAVPIQNLISAPDLGSNEVQIGGLNTTDARFAIYKGYSGCVSNIYLSVNSYAMKPLEEYMLFTKNGAEKVNVTNSQGVRSAQCSTRFDLPPDMQLQNAFPDIHNGSLATDKTWSEEPPARIPYKSLYLSTSTEEESSNVVFIILTTIFIIVVIGCSYEVWRNNKQHKARLERETDESIIWSKEQATKFHESPGLGLRSHTYKSVPTEDDTTVSPKKVVTIAIPNGTKPSSGIKNNGVPTNGGPGIVTNGGSVANVIPTPVVIVNGPDISKDVTNDNNVPPPPKVKSIGFRDSLVEKELAWEPLVESTELLPTDREITENDSEDEGDFDENKTNRGGAAALATEESDSSAPASYEEMDNSNFLGYCEQTSLSDRDESNNDDMEKPRRKIKMPSQILFYDNSRIFKNPISYLGGPVIEDSSITSLESLLSLESNI